MESTVNSSTLSPQQQMCSMTFVILANYSCKDERFCSFFDSSVFLLPLFSERFFNVRFIQLSFNLLLWMSLEMAFFTVPALIFFNFSRRLSLCSSCFSLFKLNPDLMLRFQQFFLVSVFLMSSSSQSLQFSQQSTSGENPPSSSISISRQPQLYYYSSIASWFLSQTRMSLLYLKPYDICPLNCSSIIGSAYFSFMYSEKHCSISEFSTGCDCTKLAFIQLAQAFYKTQRVMELCLFLWRQRGPFCGKLDCSEFYGWLLIGLLCYLLTIQSVSCCKSTFF